MIKQFLEGFSKVLDITGALSKRELLKIKPIPVMSDRDALASDWQAVGKYIRKSIKKEIAHPAKMLKRTRRYSTKRDEHLRSS